MRTNIEIDDELMADAMEAGGFKTKREAVEEGLRMIKRRKAYAALLAARGTLHWDDSDEGWAQWRAQQALQVSEPDAAPYVAQAPAEQAKAKLEQAKPARAKPAAAKPARTTRSKRSPGK
jgi:Arc/MetJ family transcription regulator